MPSKLHIIHYLKYCSKWNSLLTASCSRWEVSWRPKGRHSLPMKSDVLDVVLKNTLCSLFKMKSAHCSMTFHVTYTTWHPTNRKGCSCTHCSMKYSMRSFLTFDPELMTINDDDIGYVGWSHTKHILAHAYKLQWYSTKVTVTHCLWRLYHFVLFYYRLPSNNLVLMR